VKDLLDASWLLFVTHLPRHVRARRFNVLVLCTL